MFSDPWWKPCCLYTNLSLLGSGWLTGGLSCLSVVRSLLPVVLCPGCAVVRLASWCGCCSSCCSWSCSCCPRSGATCLSWGGGKRDKAQLTTKVMLLSLGCRTNKNWQAVVHLLLPTFIQFSFLYKRFLSFMHKTSSSLYCTSCANQFMAGKIRNRTLGMLNHFHK